ncbi:type II toxin-antitoxin system HipA family toxin [sulfur-oxidizing endosymbiont of Gigantopelta aegis]|uniref:type II toxin-antitoxin system HipA family toxin n=1 Tax=sulfur-oxidizing endosymbiont of Gigantopelta aegis TaxID=2794934 RepID=UPI0018DE539D|nr:type II toxin-antitoxin system HipA family toxin [sulfur-oxidizing endosymbiont of Gigantopelta aegis]
MTERLEVRLGDMLVGTLTLVTGDRSFFAFEEAYLNEANRPILSQSFFTRSGDLIPESKIVQTKLPPFFSNLLPEGHLRDYLATRGGIKPAREFKLIELLGEDLSGAVIVRPIDALTNLKESEKGGMIQENAPYRFSLAGVQLKFSAMAESTGGLTIPAGGVGGGWIIKLPAQNFGSVPENEWSMLQLAREIGINVPETRLIDLSDVAGLPDLGVLSGNQALAIKRFDRGAKGMRIHIEDFAQVYGLFPNAKYSKVSYANIANMVWTLTGEAGLVDFIRRLVFNIIIGNGDMHLKNWSFIYPDGKTPQLAPAYDYVSTVPYIPNDSLALNLSGTKDMGSISLAHFEKLVKKAQVPKYLVLSAVKETVEAVHDIWNKNQLHYPLPSEILTRIKKHMAVCKLVV